MAPARKKTTAAKRTAAKRTTAAATPAASRPAGAATAATTPTYPTDGTVPEQPPAPQIDAPTSAPSSVTRGEVVRLAPTEDEPSAPTSHVLVVGTVDGTDARPDGALVVSLPEARWVPLDQLATDH